MNYNMKIIGGKPKAKKFWKASKSSYQPKAFQKDEKVQ